MEQNQKPLSELLSIYTWTSLQGEWHQVQERWYTIYEHWYPLLADEWPTDVLAVEAEWFLADVPLDTFRQLFQQRGIEWIWELRGAEAPASFFLACDLFSPYYTGDEGYWTSEGYDWLVYASQERSLTFAGSWLIEAVKKLWPDWEQHVWRGAEYIRPPRTVTPRPRGALPGNEHFKYDVRLLSRIERTDVWNTFKERWHIRLDPWEWYPLNGETGQVSNCLWLQAEWFSLAVSQVTLAEIMQRRGIERVWGMKEGIGVVWEVDRELIEPWYDGIESYWTSSEMNWAIFASHESSITILGDWLVEIIKEVWPEWQQHLYQTYAYKSPSEEFVFSPSKKLPRTF